MSRIHIYPRRSERVKIYQMISDWVRPSGVEVAPDNLILTHGGQNAIELAARAILANGRGVIAMDRLFYPGLRMAIQAAGAELVGVDMEIAQALIASGAAHEFRRAVIAKNTQRLELAVNHLGHRVAKKSTLYLAAFATGVADIKPFHGMRAARRDRAPVR